AIDQARQTSAQPKYCWCIWSPWPDWPQRPRHHRKDLWIDRAGIPCPTAGPDTCSGGHEVARSQSDPCSRCYYLDIGRTPAAQGLEGYRRIRRAENEEALTAGNRCLGGPVAARSD